MKKFRYKTGSLEWLQRFVVIACMAFPVSTWGQSDSLVSIQVTPITSLIPGWAITPVQYTAVGTYASGAQRNITRTVNWSVNNYGGWFGSIDSTGVLHPVSLNGWGSSVTASRNGVTSSPAAFSVTQGNDVMITVTPSAKVVVTGDSIQYQANQTQANAPTPVNVTNQQTWTSDHPKNVSITTTGLAKAIAPGKSRITAFYNAWNTMKPLAVANINSPTYLSVVPCPIQTIAINAPDSIMDPNTIQHYKAIGTCADGSQHDITQSVMWQSSSPDIAFISLEGLAAAWKIGRTTITATLDSISSPALGLRVREIPRLISIIPYDSTVLLGKSIHYMAIALYKNDSMANITEVAKWKSHRPDIAAVNSDGVVSGLLPGRAEISASHHGVTGSFKLKVISSKLIALAITTPDSLLLQGDRLPLKVTGTYQDGTIKTLTDEVRWKSNNPASVAVNERGLASGAKVGKASITASTTGLTSPPSVLYVLPNIAVSLSVSAPDTVIISGEDMPIKAIVTYQDGSTRSIGKEANWASDNGFIAAFTKSGKIKAISPGKVKITASYKGLTSPPFVITVIQEPLKSAKNKEEGK